MKNQELNLVELLKDCPKGTKLYSPLFGEVEIRSIDDVIRITTNRSEVSMFYKNGQYYDYPNTECLLFPSKDQRDWNVWKEEQDKKKSANTIKEGCYVRCQDGDVLKVVDIDDLDKIKAHIRVKTLDIGAPLYFTKPQWELTKINKYPIECFQPFDKVLVRDANTGTWFPDFYGIKNNEEYHICVGGPSNQCIPYNEETKHLLGTTDNAPEFYINWEE